MNGKLPLIAGLCAMILHGCASSSLTKTDSSNGLPQELPKELQQKFEVKEALSPDPASPAASDSKPSAPVKRKGKGKKSKANSQVKPAPATSAPGGPAPAGNTPAQTPGASPSATPSAAPSSIVYPSRRPQKDPIWIGEEGVYEVTFFGMAAASMTLQVLPYKEINNRKVYSVRGTAVSSKVFNLFYTLNDRIETFFDYDGLFSHRFHIVLDETKQYRDSLELFDSEKGETYWWNRWDRKEKGYFENKEYHPIPAFSQDSLSALYYLRTQPLPDGGVVTFPVVSEGKAWECVVTVVRREMMDTPMGKIRTVVLKPEHKLQGVLQNKGDSFIWLTDDDRRHLVRMEAKVRIGTVVARLKELRPGTEPQP